MQGPVYASLEQDEKVNSVSLTLFGKDKNCFKSHSGVAEPNVTFEVEEGVTEGALLTVGAGAGVTDSLVIQPRPQVV